MNLDELQRLAEGATPGPWEADYAGEGSSGKFLMTECFVRRPGDNISIAADVCTPAGRPCIENAAYIAAMSPDTAKKLIAVAKVVEEAHALVQEFKTRWMALPPFAEKINRATREGMTMAHQPIMQAEERLRTALEELKHGT